MYYNNTEVKNMLYDEDNNPKGLVISDEINKIHSRKKILIGGAIILCCIFAMVIGIGVSHKMSNKTQAAEVAQEAPVQEKKEEPKKLPSNNKEKLAVYSGEHMQIGVHSLDQIKYKFTPKYNHNAQQEITNIYYSEEKVAYLTFDDGPTKTITPQILDILKQEQVPATFFVLGSRVELNPDILRRTFEEGHYIANHGYSHKYSQIYTSRDTVFDEYIKCENAIRNALGNQEYNTYLFRFPGGSSGGRYAGVKAEAKQLLNSYGVNYTNWNCLTGDAEGNTTPEAIMGCLQQSMEGDGSIIVLMHDASDKTYTVETLPTVIAYLREQGYTFKNFYGIF